MNSGGYSSISPSQPGGLFGLDPMINQTLALRPPCDLNADGVANNLDVPIAIKAALGPRACRHADLRGDGVSDVVDVGRVIAVALCGACRTGP